MIGDVLDPHRLGVPRDGPQQTAAAGRRPDSLHGLLVDPHMDELLEPTIIVEHTKRPVAGTGQFHSRLHGGQ